MGIFSKKNKNAVTPDKYRTNLNIKKRNAIIHHYCPHTFNAGDHFVIRSIRKYLSERLPEAVYQPKACADNRGWGSPIRLIGKNIDFSNRYADAVVIGGSDQYNNWSLRIKKEEIVTLAPPLYLIGLGISSPDLKSKPRIDKKEYLEDIVATNHHARLSSVRDQITYDFLSELGIQKHVLTGCPAMYLFNEKFSYKDSDYAVLTFPFPVVRSSNKSAYKEILKLIHDTLQMVKAKGLRPIVVCHDDRDLPQAQELFPDEELFFSNYFEEFYPLYQNARMIIGTRLHATILAAGMGTPFLNINLDLRGKGFTETFELQDWNLNIDDKKIKSKLSERIDELAAANLEPFEKFYKIKEMYRRAYSSFMDGVAEDIKSNMQF